MTIKLNQLNPTNMVINPKKYMVYVCYLMAMVVGGVNIIRSHPMKNRDWGSHLTSSQGVYPMS